MMRVSVIVVTLRRPLPLRQAVASILACRHDSFELLVADQNAPGETAALLAEWAGDARLRILHMPPVGLSAAQNRAAAEARGEILLFTDDDCEVGADWIAQVEAAFGRHPEAGVLLGAVAAAEHEREAGFVPAVQRREERVWRSAWEKPELEVMGACMAVRRGSWETLGGFPPRIGPGIFLNSGGDYDLVLRAWLAGVAVLETPRVQVLHHGFRSWEQAKDLLEGYAYGTALVLALRTVGRPRLLGRSLWSYWRSYREKRSTLVASAGEMAERHKGGQPKRLVYFARGLGHGAWMALGERFGNQA